MENTELASGQPTRVALQRNAITNPSGSGVPFVEGFADFGGGWVRLDGQWAVALNQTAQVGLAVSAHDNSATETAMFSNVQFVPPTVPTLFGRVPGTAVAGPAGGPGFFGIREVISNGPINHLDDAVNSLASGTGTIVNYTSPVINIHDSGSDGKAGMFRNDGVFGVVTAVGPPPPPPLGGVNDISMVAHGKIVVPAAGPWTFCVSSDDGFELVIDGVPVARASRDKRISDVLGTIDLSAGEHNLQLVYWEGFDRSAVELSAAQGVKTARNNNFRLIGHTAGPNIAIPGLGELWVTTTTPVPPHFPPPAPGITNLPAAVAALAAGPTTTVPDRSINYDDPHDGWFHDGRRNRIPGDRPFPNNTLFDDQDYASRSNGTLVIPVDGTYHIGFCADDGASLQIFNQPWNSIVTDATGVGVISFDTMVADVLSPDNYIVGEITLAAGIYEFELLHFNHIGGDHLELFGASATAPIYELLMVGGAKTFADFDGLQLVPEPGTMALLGLGGLGVLLRRRRRHNHKV